MKCLSISGKIIAKNLFGKRYSKRFINKRLLKKLNLYLIPSLAVDGIIFEDNKILLIKRRNEPFKGYYALPGGFVECGESCEEAIIREIKEETNLDVEIEKLLNVYSNPNRDPRGHVVSVVYILRVVGGSLKAGDDAKEVKFFEINKIPKLAFDHEKIIKDFLGEI
ncbi:NUDIX hydrolase [Methanocaldococcus infernus ME]|uniref:NUDIX hydrolase n=1 Tax=Methanocaldococcus infernus (strain DSM 11812 / JCM 15783 / ME) TaxID=573063 RepID=D5VRR0_METIM|nr:NUDIX hydrolase [Methanocaldococcus infernus]ADG13263.1 NUDIX hydrolase [Methanocaldococcus infernus ME]